MSSLLFVNRNFVELLLTTELKQQKTLLSSLTDSQTDLITEIFHNLAHVIELNPQQRKFLKSKLKVIKLLSKVNKSRKGRKQLIRKNTIPVLAVLSRVKDNILTTLDSLLNNLEKTYENE